MICFRPNSRPSDLVRYTSLDTLRWTNYTRQDKVASDVHRPSLNGP